MDGRYDIQAENTRSQITYYAMTSEPHLWVWKETLEWEKSDGIYYVDREALSIFDAVSGLTEFEAAYGQGIEAVSYTHLDVYKRQVFTLGIAVIPELQRDENSGGVRVLQEAMEGFRILQTNKGMLGLVLIGSLYTLALMPTSALFPLMSMSYFNGTSTNASIVEVVFSVGLLFGSLVLSRWGGTKNRVYTIVGSFLLMSFSLFISGMLPPGGFWLFAACSWLMGVSGPFYWGMYTPLLQSNFEDRYLGRVLSLSSSIRLLSGPLGPVSYTHLDVYKRQQ